MLPTSSHRCSRRVFLAHTVPVSVALFATAHSRRIAACQGPALALEEDAAKANLARPARDLKLLFSGPDDVTDTWGQVHFGATAMQKIRDCEHPGFTVACCLPRDDGAWDVYGQIFRRGDPASMFEEQHRWELIRAITRDGSHFERVESLYVSEPGPWTDHLGLAYSPDAREFLALKLRIDDNGFGYRAFFSPDGQHWHEHPANPLFYDCDSLGLFWSPRARRFICTNKTLQPFLKHIQDHGGTHPQNQNDDLRDRRVIAIRSSPDGRVWEPSASLMDVWNRLDSYQPLPGEFMTVPDPGDPPDMEMYRGIGFWYHDRSFMVVLNYAASPLMRGKHGPQLDTEWWVSRDGLRWDRPYRDLNAVGDAFPRVVCITHNPLCIDGMLLFHCGDQLRGMKQDRISYVGARANAELSTVAFLMPDADLCLNAAVPSPDRPFAHEQAYVMVGVLGEDGKILPGFEPEQCIVRNVDDIAVALRWSGRSARELAGQTVRLRVHLRSASIYAVRSA